MQIEAVLVLEKYRGQKIGSWMFDQAISYAKDMDVSIVGPTTNKKRSKQNVFIKSLALRQVRKV